MILLTGATGCIGGRLLAALEARGHVVRCMTRRPAALAGRVGTGTEAVHGDCLDPASLQGPLAGIDTAYYLVHSMGGGADFEAQDRAAARNFGAAARAAGVRRIVYVGGLGAEAGLSRHLRSRHETGEVLREAGVPVVELRSGIVLGPGSLSFELIRALVERLPVMICPSWVRTPTQPIALADLVAYLVAVLDLPPGESRVYEVGGADVVSYADIMREYARQRGLRRWLIPVPLLTPHLSSLWLGLTTPVYARVGRELVDGLRTATVASDDAARTRSPSAPSGCGRRLRGRWRRRTRRSRPPAGRTRRPVGGAFGCGGAAPASATGWSTRARSTCPRRRPPPSRPSVASAATTAGTTATGCGGCAASSTGCSAGWA